MYIVTYLTLIKALRDRDFLTYESWKMRHAFVLLFGYMSLLIVAVASILHRTPLRLSSALAYTLLVSVHMFAAHSKSLSQSIRQLIALSFLVTLNTVLVSVSHGHIYAHMGFLIVVCVLSLYKSIVVSLTGVVFAALYYMVIGVSSPGLVYTQGLVGSDAYEWSFVLFTSVTLIAAISAVAWLLEYGSTKDVLSLEKDLALTVIRNRQISEIQDNVLQSLTIALYSTDEKSSAYKSLNAALSDSKEVASLLRSKDFLDSEDFVRSSENNFTAESE